MSIEEIKTDRAKVVEECKELLMAVASHGCDAVVIIGIKNGNVFCEVSQQMSMLRAIGACEVAKDKLLKSWEQ